MGKTCLKIEGYMQWPGRDWSYKVAQGGSDNIGSGLQRTEIINMMKGFA